LAESADPFFRFHIEHVIARQHGGSDEVENLALACYHCNARKGPNLSAVDPITAAVTRLFHPRRDAWSEHFVLNGSIVEGKTGIGRATVALLKMNVAARRKLRG
jgi:hypothetical protein